MTRTLLAVLALGMLVSSSPPSASAGGALIETTAPLADRSEESVKAAVVAAVDKAVRGAAAMGFEWFQLRGAAVSADEVAVQILATDDDPVRVEEMDPGTEPDAAEGDEDRAGESSPGPPIAENSWVHI